MCGIGTSGSIPCSRKRSFRERSAAPHERRAQEAELSAIGVRVHTGIPVALELSLLLRPLPKGGVTEEPSVLQR